MKVRLNSLSKLTSLLGLGLASIFITITPIKAAERVIFSSPIGDFSLPVDSLELYAKEGRKDRDFAYYARFIGDEELGKLRTLLNRKIQVPPQQISQFLYSSMGKIGLEYIGEYVRTESRLRGFYAMRAALILAAAEPDGMGIIGILRNFPSPTMRVNGNAVFRVFSEVTDLFAATEKASKFIANQGKIEQIDGNSQFNLDLRQRGKFQWEKQTLDLTDQRRLTNRNNPRQFKTDLYLPQEENPVPLLVISHGFGSDRTDFIYLAEHLASHGFGVAVLDHPGSSYERLQAFLRGEVNDASEAREFVNRPQDITFLLDRLTELNQGELGGRIDLEKIGTIGHSFGGYTTLAVAGAELNLPMLRRECRVGNFNLNDGNTSYLLQCLAQGLPRFTTPNLQDKRVGAVFAINPIGAGIFGEKGLQKIQVPTVIAASSDDVVAPAVLEQICPFTWLKSSEKTLIFTQQGSHTDANQNSGSSAIPLETNIASPNPNLGRNYYKAMALAFAQFYVGGNQDYGRYLQPGYVNKISQQPMPLFLIKDLSKEQVKQELGVECLGAE